MRTIGFIYFHISSLLTVPSECPHGLVLCPLVLKLSPSVDFTVRLCRNMLFERLIFSLTGLMTTRISHNGSPPRIF